MCNCTTHYVKESYLLGEVFRQVRTVIHQNQTDTRLFRKKLRAAAKSKFDERTQTAKIRMNEIQKQLDRIMTMRVTAFDEKLNDSNSVAHQKELLIDYANSHGFTNYRLYVDM